ncbi:hypothetical protein GLW03_14780 [Halobacillus halophilus]|uniref:hypothetical protein n=1 Tax=Halobacillus halophilus TaxID=1570 RepID=UPI001371497C|nr:hypothetical protein [Halobacillus halophilus]MYL31081.1 hypothetical protein [Halobacillus halophilus]
MKKYLIFIGSFILLYFVCQWLSGMLLTLQYDPETGGGAGSRPYQLLVLIGIATVSYFLSRLPDRKQGETYRAS